MRVYTLGHGRRPKGELEAIIAGHSIQRLIDCRALPRSRWPQFNQAALEQSLGAVYVFKGEVFGNHQADPNDFDAWAVGSKSFRAAGNAVAKEAALQTQALMCGCGNWEYCHRAVVAEYLEYRGVEVQHILADGVGLERHRYLGELFGKRGATR